MRCLDSIPCLNVRRRTSGSICFSLLENGDRAAEIIYHICRVLLLQCPWVANWLGLTWDSKRTNYNAFLINKCEKTGGRISCSSCCNDAGHLALIPVYIEDKASRDLKRSVNSRWIKWPFYLESLRKKHYYVNAETNGRQKCDACSIFFPLLKITWNRQHY